MSEERKTKFCSNCGAEIDIKAKICPKCGVEQPIVPEKVSNWWYVLAFFFGIIGGIIAWAVNKNRNPKKAIRFLIVGFILPLLIISLRAKEGKIMADMDDLQTRIEFYYDNHGNYLGVSCSLPEFSSTCNSIKENAGEMPTIKSSEKNYCFYVKLPSGEYYCKSSTSYGGKTTIFPGGKGYCDGVTFSCP